jgi:hypothetical protein
MAMQQKYPTTIFHEQRLNSSQSCPLSYAKGFGDVGVTAIVATLNGYTYRPYSSVSLLGSILGLSIRVIYSDLL